MKTGYIFFCFIFGHIGCTVISTRCPAHWLERPEGNSCYRFWPTRMKNWADAREQCKKSNGDLLKLDSKREKEWVIHEIKQYPVHYEWWIGLQRHKGNDSVWVWTDGTERNETMNFISWGSGEPNNYQDSEDCAEIWDNLLNDKNCEHPLQFVCERPKDLPLSCDVDNGWMEMFTQSEYCFKYIDEKLSFTEAIAKCNTEDSRIPIINEAEYQHTLTDYLRNKGNATVWSLWWDGMDCDYWEEDTHAKNETSCSVLDTKIEGDKNWRLEDCEKKNSVMCSKNQGVCPDGFVKHKNKCYLLNTQDSFTWNEARGFCNLWQTTMLEVKNDNDYFFTLSLIKNHLSLTGKTSVWHGLSGDNMGGSLKWNSGAVVESYVLEKSKDTLDSDLSGTQCGFIDNSIDSEKDDKSHWRFGDCGETRGTICTVDVGASVKPPPNLKPRYECPEGYVLHGVICYHWNPEDPVDWYTAREKCAIEGADLVTIQSDEEQEFVSSHIKSGCWIGLNDRRKEGEFKWLDSSAEVTVTKWFEKQPNNAVIGGAYTENCISMLYLPGTEDHGAWVDYPCSYKARFMCQMPAERNIALGKIASMSSIHQVTSGEYLYGFYEYDEYDYVDGDNTADKAVDGCTTRSMKSSSCCAQTGEESIPWWKLDLGTIYPIGKVVIYRHSEESCWNCNEQYRNFRLFISNSSKVGAKDETDLVYQEKRKHVPAIIVLNLQNVTVGRYVRIDIPQDSQGLKLCEVKIYQGISLQKTVDPSNSNCVSDSKQWKGDIRHTVSGRICQPWVHNSPHQHSYHDKTFPDGSEKEAENFCRDPLGEGLPWCYTEDPNVRWEFCPVPHCPSEVGTIAKSNEPTGEETDCDPGWLERPDTGVCYWLGEELLTWSDARSVCESVGATLPVPSETADVDLLTGKLTNQKANLMFWLGVYNNGDLNGWVSDIASPSKFVLDKIPQPLSSTTTCLTINQAGEIHARNCWERNVFSCMKMGHFIKYSTSSDSGFKSLFSNLVHVSTKSAVTVYSLNFDYKGIDGATVKLYGKSSSATDASYLIRIGGNIFAKSSISKFDSEKPKYSRLIQNLYNQSEFKSFWIQWTSGKDNGDDITVGRGSELGRNVFMQWTDPAGIQATEVAIATTIKVSTVYKGYWRLSDGTKGNKTSTSVNLALGRPVKQSSTFADQGVASKAVDGCILDTYGSGCITHTNFDFEPWWEVDLGRVYHIGEVVIYRRGPECCTERLGYFRLIISELSDSTLEDDVVYQSKSSEPPFIMRLPVKGRSGRYVKIDIPERKDYLELAEVEVYEDLDAAKCGVGWVENSKNGECYKFSDVPMSWTNAQKFCSGFNAKMVIPQSADEQMFLYTNSLPVIIKKVSSNSLWLGLHDRDSEGTFQTTDGSTLTYTDWAKNEPNNFGSGEDCVALRIDWSRVSGKWNDKSCDTELKVVCKRNELTTTTTSTTSTTTTTPTTTTIKTTTTTVIPTSLFQGGCEPTWIYSPISSSCLKIFKSELETFFSAAAKCLKLKARLASIANIQEQHFITEMIRLKGITGVDWQGLFVGGIDIVKEGNWEWFMDNTPWRPDIKWTPGQPDNANAEDCAIIRTEAKNLGLLNDSPCDKGSSKQGYICQYNIDDKPCDNGWVYNRQTDTCYKYEQKQKASWNDARTICETYGGILATIASRSEQLFMTALVADSNVKGAWVGAHDMGDEGVYKWIDGTRWVNDLWAPDQPNNWKFNQHCAMVNVNGIKNALGLLQDDFCHDKYPYICAIKSCPAGWEKFDKNCYLYSLLNKGWEDAKADCETKGARLVIVDNEKEHQFLKQKVKDSGVNYAWIGARYDPKYQEHRWVDGSPMTFTAWASGQPGKQQGCVDYLRHFRYLWNSHNDCVNTKGPYICEKVSLIDHGLTKPTTTSAVATTIPVSSSSPRTTVPVLSSSPRTTVPVLSSSPQTTIQTTKTTTLRKVIGKCGPDWDIDPSSIYCYKFAIELSTWTDAQAKCTEEGGSLASIVSDEEQSYIIGRLQGIQMLPEAMWIGATDADFEAGWKWVDDKPFAYLNWAYGEPNSGGLAGDGEEDCVAIATYIGQYFGQWNDLPCDSKRGYICKRKVDTGQTTHTASSSPSPTIASDKYYGCAGKGWLGYRDSCYLVVQAKNDWNEANRYCHKEGAELASIDNEEEQNFVFSQLPHESYCFNTWNDTECSNWAERGECDRNPVWMATNCHLACKHCFHNCRDRYQSSSKCLEWARLRECSANPSWMLKNCAMSCGVCQGAPTRGYWIGLQSSGMDQSYTWSDHSAVKYTNWNNHQPVWFNLQPRSCVAMFIQNGKWNDGQCEDPLQGFVCKQPKMIARSTSQSPFKVGCALDNSYGYGPFCYVYVQQQKSWTEAKSNCKSLGGHLTYIGDVYIQAFVASELQTLSKDHWIGLSLSSGNWSWDGKDDTMLTFTHFDRSVNVDGADNEGCFAMTTYKPVGLWKFYPDCSIKLPSICQLPRDGFTTTPSTTAVSSTTPLPDCEEGWQPYGINCYKFSDKKQSWYHSQQICSHYGGSLASIHDQQENTAVTNMRPTRDPYWIGLHDTDKEGDFIWDDGSPAHFTAFLENEPNNANGNENCVEIAGSYFQGWNDVPCEMVRYYICKIPKGKSVNKDPHTINTLPACNVDTPDDGWTLRGEFCYFLGGEDEPVTFHDAVDKCKEVGSQLASVHSEEENGFLSSIASGGVSWLGFNDLDLDNRFSWSDGTVVDFTKWDSGQPNDINGGEKCVVMHGAGVWHDYPCNDLKPYICKRRKDGVTATTSPATTPFIQGGCPKSFNYNIGNKCYYFHTDGYTSNWANSQESCDFRGGQLVSIHSELEQAFISANIYGSENAVWIGMHDLNEDGRFDWTDNSRVDYTNWGPNEPSSNKFSFAMEPCVEMWTDASHAGKWNDVKCYAARGYICSTSKDASKVSVENCPEGYTYIRTSCYKVLASKQSWNRSVDICSSEGATLMPLTDAPDNLIIDFLQKFSGQQDLWTGGTSYQGDIKWNDGMTSPFLRTDISSIGTGCLYWTSQNLLATDSCATSRSAICAIKTDMESRTSIAPTTEPVPITNRTIHTYTCRDKSWFLYDSYCYSVVYEFSTYGNTKCSKYGMHLASIHSASENYKLVSWILRWHHSNQQVAYPYLWIGLALQSGMSDNQWSDGSSVDYIHIEDDAGPSLGCVRLMLFTGQWKVVSCDEKHFYICKGNADIMTTTIPNTTPDMTTGTEQVTPEKPTMTYDNSSRINIRERILLEGSKSSGLTGGQIAGIVIGVLGLLVIIGVLVFILRSWSLRKPSYHLQKPSLGFDNALFHKTQETVSID